MPAPDVASTPPVAVGMNVSLQYTFVIEHEVVPIQAKCLSLFDVLNGYNHTGLLADKMDERTVQDFHLQLLRMCKLGYNQTGSALHW